MLPRIFVGKVLQTLHDSLFGGHSGTGTTLSKIRLKYHWFGMSADVRAHARACARDRKQGVQRDKPLH